MSTIIRCPNCFTYVYADARSCHGCGERLGRRKLLRGGSWLFIVLAVGAFTIARGIDLSQERMYERRTKAAQQWLANDARAFVAAWLQADTEYVQNHLADREVCPDELSKMRARYPTVLPADTVVGFQVTDSSYQEHVQVERGRGISHRINGQADPKGLGRVSCAPKTRSLGTYRRSADGVKRRFWTTPLIEFEIEFRKDGAHYTLFGDLCIEDGKVSCFKVDHIRGIEGDVKPTE
jgi:hypothetical protein